MAMAGAWCLRGRQLRHGNEQERRGENEGFLTTKSLSSLDGLGRPSLARIGGGDPWLSARKTMMLMAMQCAQASDLQRVDKDGLLSAAGHGARPRVCGGYGGEQRRSPMRLVARGREREVRGMWCRLEPCRASRQAGGGMGWPCAHRARAVHPTGRRKKTSLPLVGWASQMGCQVSAR